MAVDGIEGHAAVRLKAEIEVALFTAGAPASAAVGVVFGCDNDSAGDNGNRWNTAPRMICSCRDIYIPITTVAVIWLPAETAGAGMSAVGAGERVISGAGRAWLLHTTIFRAAMGLGSEKESPCAQVS